MKKRSDISREPADGRRLLAWYDQNRRILPWREEPSAYHIWISEIMLQQTRVDTVIGYYLRFLEKFPSAGDFAAAREDEYLKMWEGLGYYSRVRNMHKAAVKVMEEYGGKLPPSSDELMKLPGIGPYTAAAIASIAFGEVIPALDGNLLRVFARMTACPDDISLPGVRTQAKEWYLSIMEIEPVPERPGDFNQAMMDLGATVCLPNAAPRCGECPWADSCRAHAEASEVRDRAPEIRNEVSETRDKIWDERRYPVMPAKEKRKIEEKTVFVILAGKRAVLHKRPPRGMLAGLYEFPNTPGKLDAVRAESFVRSLGLEPLRIRPLPDARHIFTHREWEMTGFEVIADEPDAADREEMLRKDGYLLAELKKAQEEYAVPSAFRVYYNHFKSMRL